MAPRIRIQSVARHLRRAAAGEIREHAPVRRSCFGASHGSFCSFIRFQVSLLCGRPKANEHKDQDQENTADFD